MNNYKGQGKELILLAMWILGNFQYYNIYNDVPARKIIKTIVDDFFYCTSSKIGYSQIRQLTWLKDTLREYLRQNVSFEFSKLLSIEKIFDEINEELF